MASRRVEAEVRVVLDDREPELGVVVGDTREDREVELPEQLVGDRDARMEVVEEGPVPVPGDVCEHTATLAGSDL